MADTPVQTPTTPDAGTTATPGASPTPDPAKAPDKPVEGATPADGNTLLTAKPDEGKPAEKPADAPEKYEFKLDEKLGALNQPLVDAVVPLFREFKLTQEQASKLVTVVATKAHELNAATEQQREADFKTWMADQQKANLAAIRKEWGNDYDANLKTAQRAIARFASPEAKKLLDETALGSNPAFAAMFLAIGKLITEDTPPNPKGSGNGRLPLEQVLYPGMST